MIPQKRFFTLFYTLLFISSFFLTEARAINSINVQTFNPSVSDHFVILEDGFKSEWPRASKYYFGANYNYVDSPLVAVDNANNTNLFNIIDSIQTLDLFFGFKASPRFGLFIGGPIHYVTYPSTPAAGYPSGSATALGDLKLEAKIRLTDDTSDTAIALIPEIHLPTGNTENFVSDASVYMGLRLAIEHPFRNFTLNGNLGFAAASNAIYTNPPTIVSGIDYRKRFMFGLGGFIPFNDRWGMNLEFSSINMIPFSSYLNPNELYAGARYAAADNLIFTLGGSLGKIGGPTGQTYRIIAGIRYTIPEEDKSTSTPNPVFITPPAAAATPAPIVPAAPRAVMRTRHIEILSPINFEHDSDRLTPEGKEIVNEVADIILRNQKNLSKILIDGHTNEIGDDQYNLRLSLARSKAVKNYLVTRKVPATMLEARGFGKRKPKVAYSDPTAIEVNRRVEFIVVKKAKP